MAVIERERVSTGEQAPERAIFVAADGRRARRLRRAAFAAAFLACLWVVGLGVGMLGFGSLPGVSLVKQQVDEIAGGSADAPRAERNDTRRTVRRSSLLESRVVANARQTSAVQSRARGRSRPTASRPVSRPPAGQVTPPPPVAQQPVNPAQRTRGWARDGQTAPPGQARKTTPPPPPGTRGRGHAQTPPTTPPPVPPGQAKKALPPPPPPPPPLPPPKKA
jgi:hypothetical protein